MLWVLLGLVGMAFSGLAGVAASRQGVWGERSAAVLLLGGVLAALVGIVVTPEGGAGARLVLPWGVPGGLLALELDPLTRVFLLPLLLIAASGALYGLGYWPQRRHPDNGRKFRLFYGLIVAAMVLLLTARNGLLFLLAWEIMAVSGFFLVTTEETREEARRAGFIYLVATHCGTLALIAMFVLVGEGAGGLLFPAAGGLAGEGTAVFLLGLFGFGLKAGLMPLHIWLPGAHAAAPSHASALLSGAMIKTGIYGLTRITSFFAEIPPWWGWTVLLLGALSAILGVAYALAQHDLKRLLAYHSVENIGIIAMGLGLALLGRSYELPALVLLGLGGALLHVVNHGLFKSLLFLSAGAVVHATGTRELSRFGGLLRRQPWTAALFLIGAVAISGLPPFNGFVSEFLIYLGALTALASKTLAVNLAVLTVPALALVGGLALACFVKVFGIVFLGEPRSAEAAAAHEASLGMRGAMLPLAASCCWIGLLPATVVPLLGSAVGAWDPAPGTAPLPAPFAALSLIGLCGWLLLLLVAGGGWWLWRRSRAVSGEVGTWGCGYAFPTARMQYSASSFADGLVGLFRWGLGSVRAGGAVRGLFPEGGHFHSHTPDAVLDRALLPGFRLLGRGMVWVRARVQNGMVACYLLYVALTLLFLLIFSI